jgi:hypothetical protein
MYHRRVEPPNDASLGPVAFSAATDSGTPGLHVRPSSDEDET